MYLTRLLTSVLAVAGLAGSALAQTSYEIDPVHSSIQFCVRHLMISNIKGQFTGFKGTVVYDPGNLAKSRVEAVIDANTINTHNAKRDEHLRNPDFFDTAKYPAITFKSKQISKNNGKVQMKGDLTMHGVTREVVFDVDGPSAEIKDPRGNNRIGASATTKISRKAWGIAFNEVLEAGGVSIGDEVTITLDIEAVKKAAPAVTSKAAGN
jgi:polyisoprenoid-binding protein YceI